MFVLYASACKCLTQIVKALKKKKLAVLHLRILDGKQIVSCQECTTLIPNKKDDHTAAEMQ